MHPMHALTALSGLPNLLLVLAQVADAVNYVRVLVRRSGVVEVEGGVVPAGYQHTCWTHGAGWNRQLPRLVENF